MRVAIYTRAHPSKHQAHSLAMQEQQCREWAERHGHEVAGLLVASPGNRGLWQRVVDWFRSFRRGGPPTPRDVLTRAIESGQYDIIVAATADRFARMLPDLLELRSLGTQNDTRLYAASPDVGMTGETGEVLMGPGNGMEGLLARSLLVKNRDVPPDIVPYDD